MTNVERNAGLVQRISEGSKNESFYGMDEIDTFIQIDISMSLARIADSLEKLVSVQKGEG